MKRPYKPSLQQRLGDFVRSNRRRWQKSQAGEARVKVAKPAAKISVVAKAKKNATVGSSSGVVRRIFASISGKTKLVVLFLLLAILVGFHLVRYFSFPLERFYLDNAQTASKVILGNKLNIMLFLYERDGDFSYIDTLMLLSFDAAEARAEAFILNPEFGTRALGNSYVKIRNLLSNAEIAQQQPVRVLESLVEGTLGLPVDRYMAIESSKFVDMLAVLGINSITTVDVVKDEDAGEFKLNERVDGEDIAKYLAADADGNNRKLARAGKVLEKMMVEDTNYGTAISVYLHLEDLTSYFQTNMSRGEILNVASIVWNLRTLNTQYIAANDTFLIENKGNNFLVPNLALTDQKVRATFAQQKVVREQARIEIYNATKTNGLANTFRRRLYNQGGNVIRAGTFPEPQEETVLYVPNLQNYPFTVALVKEVTRGKVKLIEESYPFNHTAELVLVLGTDVVQ